ncbi:uncharacterized protein LOC127104875 [Lathyrus oleraceus]|uniref:uncharacterized protein LOC127104875 n=1 Tax=Pisum sativum TaxID=3888 RepID=UPI0021CED7ED|nr:uncharacterized protein LOC127104875 [Pisum sativum]
MQKPSVCSVIISLILAERASSNNVLAPIRRGHKLASMIWLAVVDNLEENHHTFCLLKRLAREGDIIQNQPNANGNDEFRHLGKFQRNNLPAFKSRYDPDGAHTWLREIERIFIVMDFSEAQKVRFGMHMLAEEVDGWWINTRQMLDDAAEVGNLSVIEYAAIFVELAKFYPHYSEAITEFPKCIKFKNGLHPEIKQAIGYQKIRRFPELVNNCRIYKDDSKAQSAHYKGLGERRVKQNMRCGKPYSALVVKVK